jgi:hypothetical protein
MRIGKYIYPVRSLQDVVPALDYALRAALARGERGFDPARAGILYRPEPGRIDRLQWPSETLARGAGDCEDLTLALALYLIQRREFVSFAAQDVPQYGGHVLLISVFGLRDPSRECLRKEMGI